MQTPVCALPCMSRGLCHPGLLVLPLQVKLSAGLCLGFPVCFKPEKSHKAISCGNHRSSPICFLPFKVHCFPLPDILCLAAHCFIYFVHFMVVSGRKVIQFLKSILFTSEDQTLLYISKSLSSLYSINFCKYLKHDDYHS